MCDAEKVRRRKTLIIGAIDYSFCRQLLRSMNCDDNNIIIYNRFEFPV